MIIAFDGIKGAGKTTLITMLEAHSANAVVVRENDHDPLRPLIEEAYAIANGIGRDEPGGWEEVTRTLWGATKEVDRALNGEHEKVVDYYINYHEDAERSQAYLAYLFTFGRTHTQRVMEKLAQEHDVILNRWQLSGWVGQCCGDHDWRAIRALNQKLGIRWPNEQFIVLYPPDDIAARREIREKHGVVKKSQLTVKQEREHIEKYTHIQEELCREGTLIDIIDNNGEPTMDENKQLEQAHFTYCEQVVPFLADKGYRFKAPRLELTAALKKRILERQRAE